MDAGGCGYSAYTKSGCTCSDVIAQGAITWGTDGCSWQSYNKLLQRVSCPVQYMMLQFMQVGKKKYIKKTHTCKTQNSVAQHRMWSIVFYKAQSKHNQ